MRTIMALLIGLLLATPALANDRPTAPVEEYVCGSPAVEETFPLTGGNVGECSDRVTALDDEDGDLIVDYAERRMCGRQVVRDTYNDQAGAPLGPCNNESDWFPADGDDDGVPDTVDNCPTVANTAQNDTDGDLRGDACDEDADGDGRLNSNDDFPYDPLRQDDSDGDGIDDDYDRDNCVDTPNPDQADLDGDGAGDACDGDRDGDEISNNDDWFPDNGSAAGDWDDDGVDTLQDNCDNTYNPDQANLDGDDYGDACDSDRDGDGRSNSIDDYPDDRQRWSDNDGDGIDEQIGRDNCEGTYNPDQEDLDNDGRGDACDIDADGDGINDEDEPAYCSAEDPDLPADGSCDGDDYTPPAPVPPTDDHTSGSGGAGRED